MTHDTSQDGHLRKQLDKPGKPSLLDQQPPADTVMTAADVPAAAAAAAAASHLRINREVTPITQVAPVQLTPRGRVHLLVLLLILLLFLLVCFCFCLCLLRQGGDCYDSGGSNAADATWAGTPGRTYSYGELAAATQGYSDANKLGAGEPGCWAATHKLFGCIAGPVCR
jgi:hypothetical protein